MTTRQRSTGSSDPDDLAETAARPGWIAKGFLFVVIGGLAFRLARRGTTPDDPDQQGALSLLAESPYGRGLLATVGAGLVLYGTWQVWSAIRSDSDELLDHLRRIGWVGLAVVYGTLGFTALRAAWEGGESEVSDQGGQGGATSPREITEHVLDLPGGVALVAAVGVGTLVVAAYHLRKGLKLDFLDDIDVHDLPSVGRRVLATLGVVGFAARALILGTAGSLFVVAAWQHDPDDAAGLDDALRTLAEAPFGRALLAVCAIGLVAAGLYDMVTFRRQRIG